MPLRSESPQEERNLAPRCDPLPVARPPLPKRDSTVMYSIFALRLDAKAQKNDD